MDATSMLYILTVLCLRRSMLTYYVDSEIRRKAECETSLMILGLLSRIPDMSFAVLFVHFRNRNRLLCEANEGRV